jgi:protease YdgD
MDALLTGTRGRFLRAIFLALLLGGLQSPSRAADETVRLPGIQGRDDRVMLDSVEWPWTAIGRVNRGGHGFCTGTLVAADTVLTAAHCLFEDRSGRRLRPREIFFLPGYRRGEAPAVGRVRDVVVPRAFSLAERPSAQRVAYDWALLRLRRPLTTPPLPIDVLAPAPGGDADRAVLSAGYGQDRPHLLSLHDGCAVSERLAHDRILVHTCDATAGASGSPLLRRTQSGGYALVGVITGSAGDGRTERGLAVHAAAFVEAVRGLDR